MFSDKKSGEPLCDTAPESGILNRAEHNGVPVSGGKKGLLVTLLDRGDQQSMKGTEEGNEHGVSKNL